MSDNMMIDTDKMQAICKALDIDGVDIAAIEPAILTMKGRFKNIARHTLGALASLPLSDEEIDDMIARLMRMAGKGKRKNKDVDSNKFGD